MPTKQMPEILQSIKEQIKVINNDCNNIKSDLEDIKVILQKAEIIEEIKEDLVVEVVEVKKGWWLW